MINRFSSRRQTLNARTLAIRLSNAKSYDRIAGYFTSSLFEAAGDSLDTVNGPIRIICNSEIDPRDLETARAAELSMKREWSASHPEYKLLRGTPEQALSRFDRLYHFLKEGKMQVKVMPSSAFGLIHGKAGVITLADGTKTSFLGSVNETVMGWDVNYELLWEDDSEEAVCWVQEEFDALWLHPRATPLSKAVIEDVKRITKRVIVSDLAAWRKNPEAAATVIEEPIYRESIGLADHQKYFIKLAFDLHKGPHGARLVLADGVGLGKTVQLAMSAKLMALIGNKPILVIVPATLTRQWQTELKTLLNMPSAIWTGRKWVDESEIEHPSNGPEGIKKCPRRIGIISQGLVVSGSESAEYLKNGVYECVIVDESHRARRKNLGADKTDDKQDPNNLLAFINDISKRTKSLLLATATPVQLYPIEAWDLLNALAQGSENILGNSYSVWKKTPSRAISLATGNELMPSNESDLWEIIRNPLPQELENPKEFKKLRNDLSLSDLDAVVPGDKWDQLRAPARSQLKRLSKEYAQAYNPFIRHIVRRTRDYLETQFDEKGDPLLPKIEVQLFGEEDPIILPGYLKDAYNYAEEFCRLLKKRTKAAGFLETMLLRRMGSSIEAGFNTAQKILSRALDDQIQDEDNDDQEESSGGIFSEMTEEEVAVLKRYIDALDANKERDPKVDVAIDCLKNGVSGTEPWLELGCIVFSQYFDTIWWLAKTLTKEFPTEIIGVYAGGGKSGILKNGKFERIARDEIKRLVSTRSMRLILGTDAASEGLNLQTLSTLINLDLPWNPTRLEQRKGRVQRIGQVRDTVYLYNMRYKDSVEDKVHSLLSARLRSINDLFGQIPDVLQDAWVQVALDNLEEAKKTIDAVPEKHPFEMKYSKVEKIDWESCAQVLDERVKLDTLKKGW